jgi:hypothetical protein
MHTIAIGDAFNGMSLVGLFSSFELAQAYAEEMFGGAGTPYMLVKIGDVE